MAKNEPNYMMSLEISMTGHDGGETSILKVSTNKTNKDFLTTVMTDQLKKIIEEINQLYDVVLSTSPEEIEKISQMKTLDAQKMNDLISEHKKKKMN